MSQTTATSRCAIRGSRKRLEFRKVTAFHLGKPGIEVFSGAGAQHLGKLLHQVIGQINFWVDLTELAKLLLLLDTQFLRPQPQITSIQ